MNSEEKELAELEIKLLIELLNFHNEFEMKLGMSYEESVEHRLDIMEKIAELQDKLR